MPVMRGIALCLLIIILYAEYSSAAPRRSSRGRRHADESSVALSGAVARAVSTRIEGIVLRPSHSTHGMQRFLSKILCCPCNIKLLKKSSQLWKKVVVCMDDNYFFCNFSCSVQGPLNCLGNVEML